MAEGSGHQRPPRARGASDANQGGDQSVPPSALRGGSGLESVHREREAAAAQIQRSLKAWRSAGGAKGGSAAIPKGTGSPLSGEVRSRMEPKLGADLSDVKVSTSAASAAASSKLGARAFTIGNEVHFNSGEYGPGTKEGDKLLAHELTHVVQAKRSGVVQRKADEEGAEEKATGKEEKAPDKEEKAADKEEASGDEKAADEGEQEVSDPNEPAEKEADAVAEGVSDDLDKEKGEKKDGATKEGGEKKDQGEKGGGADQGEKAGEEKAPEIGAKLEGVGRKIFRTPTIPESTPAHTSLLNAYTRALGDYRAGANQLRAAYGDGMKQAGAPGPQTAPNRGKVDEATAAIQRAEASLNAQEAVFRGNQGSAKDIMQHAETLVAQRPVIKQRIDDIKAAAQLAEAAKNMTKVAELLGDGQMQPGFEIGEKWTPDRCQALAKAQTLAGSTVRAAQAALGRPTQVNDTMEDYDFGDGSRIRLDRPNPATQRDRADAARPHLAIYPPNNRDTHLSIDGIVVPANVQTAHIYLYKG
jgi:hypothetical protein